MFLGIKITLWLGLLLLLAMTACNREGAGQAPPPTPIVVNFERLAQPEPLQLAEGASFTLVGFGADTIAIADPQLLKVISPTVAPSEFSPPETTLLAIATGSTQVTVTQTLCEGVSSCSGPATFFSLTINVQ